LKGILSGVNRKLRHKIFAASIQLSNNQVEKPNRYQRGKTIINGNTRHDIRLRYIDMIGSKLIKLAMVPAIPTGVYKLARLLMEL
jgi:hypothetical protein